MKHCNININISQSQEDFDDIIKNGYSQYGHHLSMYFHDFKGTKGRIHGGRRYRGGREIFKAMQRKLASYIGWNLNKARTDFLTWCESRHYPKILWRENWNQIFDDEFKVDNYGDCKYIIKNNVVIKKKSL